MGFGFGLFFGLILVPLTGILLLIWLITKKREFGMTLVCMWLGVLGIILLSTIIGVFTRKKELDKDDIYGQYVIDRTKFPGIQADWQYNHFRFEITKEDEFLFHVTDKERINTTYKGKVTFLEAYKRPRIVLRVDTPRHHIINDEPTLYRTIWKFYYVFHSPKYGYVFFTKGKWKNL